MLRYGNTLTNRLSKLFDWWAVHALARKYIYRHATSFVSYADTFPKGEGSVFQAFLSEEGGSRRSRETDEVASCYAALRQHLDCSAA